MKCFHQNKISSYSRNSVNKIRLQEFLFERFRVYISSNLNQSEEHIFTTQGECYDSKSKCEVTKLMRNQVEADTIFFHVKYLSVRWCTLL